MKRIISFLLVFVILLSNSTVFADIGDFINTKSKKAYDIEDSQHRAELINDLKNEDLLEHFYRDIGGGEYINIVEEENAKEKAFKDLLTSKDIDMGDLRAIEEFINHPDNFAAIIAALGSITLDKKSFNEIETDGKTLDDYYGNSSTYAAKLGSDNYSSPVPGDKLGTTMITKLTLPGTATKWLYKIVDSPYNPKPDEVVLATGYFTENLAVNVTEGKHLFLSATDLSGKTKAYANIKITGDMVRKPRVPADKSEATITVTSGQDIANAIRVSGLSADKNWKYIIRSNEITIYTDDKFTDAGDYKADKDIVIVDGNTVVDENSVRYIYFINTEDDSIKEYVVKDIKKADLSSLPDKLIEGTHYRGPFHGSDENTTSFEALKLDGTDGASWMYKTGNDVNVPIADSAFDGTYINGKDIEAEVGDKLLLAAVDGNKKIKAYAIFTLTENHVSGVEPNKITLDINKGQNPGTTKASGEALPEGASKWVYAIGKDIAKPFLDREYIGAKSYTLGSDIVAKIGETLYILAVDKDNKVKAYFGIDKLGDGHIKRSLASPMEEPLNYAKPEKATTTTGASKFRYLKYGNSKLYYTLSDSPHAVPEEGSNLPDGSNPITTIANMADNIVIFEENDEKLKDEKGFIKHMMVYAVDDDKVVAYVEFKMTPENVKLPDAGVLPSDNYGSLSPGTLANSTVLDSLSKDGIANGTALKYIYRFVAPNTVPGINEVIRPANILEAGKNLTPAKVGECLQILLVDNGNRVKHYANIDLTVDNIRAGDAPKLDPGSHYSNPVPGTVFESTMFKYLGLKNVEGASQFMVAITDDRNIRIEKDSKITDSILYAKLDNGKFDYQVNNNNIRIKTDANGNIIGVKANDILLLLATDGSENVKAYQTFTLSSNMVYGKAAEKLPSQNYILEKGENPGTVRFTMLSTFGVGNNITWKYKWAGTDEFSASPPYEGQVIDASNMATKSIDQYTFEGTTNIAVEKQNDNDYGHILLLATNGNKVVQYAVVPVTEAQEAATKLTVDLKPGTSTDKTGISGTDAGKVHKYIISTSPFIEKPGPDSELPKTGVKDLPDDKQITVKVGDHLRLFSVDGNKVVGYTDIEIESKHIQQGSAKLLVEGGTTNNPYEILEGTIREKAIKLKITLTDADWADVNDPNIKRALLNGLKADGNEQSEWAKVISKTYDSRYSVDKSGNLVTITIPATDDYNISEIQNISLTIPANALLDAINPIIVTEKIVIKPTKDASISGNILDNIRQSEINSGNARILVEILDGKWIDSIDIGDLLDGFESDVDIDDGAWDSIKLILDANLIDANIISITIPKNDIKITKPETITLTIPSKLVDDSDNKDIVASPSFTIYPDILPVGVEDNIDAVVLEAPNYVSALKDKDTWTVKLDGNTTFKDSFNVTRDISTSNLPSGMKLDIVKKDNKTLEIKFTGKTSKELDDGAVNLVIKSSAINEVNYSDSQTILLKYVKGEKDDLGKVNYEIKSDGIYIDLGNIDISKLEYSINSTNVNNGTWNEIPDGGKISGLEPISLAIREKKQTGNYKLFEKIVTPIAPSGIFISSYDYKHTDGLKLILNIPIDLNIGNLEYSLGLANDWKDFPTNPNSNEITGLNENSVLTIRSKVLPGLGKEGRLPSLPTAKLNGLFLGEVKLDVSQSKIMGATRDMKYKLSDDGSWNSISTNDPTINFKEGNRVWISEAKDEKNARFLEEVKQINMDGSEENKVKTLLDSESDTDGIFYHIGDKKLVNKTGISLQYNITKGQVPTGTWYKFDNEQVVNNANFVAGNLFVRKVSGGNYLPSNPVKILEIADPINPPNMVVVEDSKTINFEADGGGYVLLNDTFEYKINTGEYQNGDLLASDPRRLGNVTVYLKRKATKELLESKEVNFKFTENISLANVKVNVAEGVIEGTTNKMEYRTDVDKDNPTNPWKITSATKTSINMYEGMYIWIREAGKPSTSKPLLENLSKMPTPDEDKLEYNIAQKFIKNNYTHILEYRINNNGWNIINVGQTISMDFVPTKLSIRTRATVDKLASDVVDVIDNLAYPDPAPEVDFDDENNEIKTIDGKDSTGDNWKDYEFKLKTDTEWMPASLLTNYDLSGNKIVQIRKKATKEKLASDIAELIFTKNINLSDVKLRETTPLTLVGTEIEMEYQIYQEGKPIPSTWIKASAGTTTLDNSIKSTDKIAIIVRDSRNVEDLVTRTLNGGRPPVGLSGVSYEIHATGVIFTGITSDMKYKFSSSNDWTDGNDSNVNTGKLEPVEIIIEDKLYPSNTRTIIVSERVETPIITVSNVSYNNPLGTEITLDGFDHNTMKFSVDNGENWRYDITSSKFIVDKDTVLIVRANAVVGDENTGKLPSLPTENLNVTSLADVAVSLDTPGLIGTTEFMEFSLDSSNGKDGKWTQAKNGSTNITLALNTVIWIRETKNTNNVRKIGPIGQETIPNLPENMIYYNVATKRISNFTDQDLEYRMAGGSWKPLNESISGSPAKYALNVDFKAGILEFRKAAKGSNFASKPITFVVIGSAGSAPVVVFDDIKDEIKSIDGKTDNSGNRLEIYEFKITVDGQTTGWSDYTEHLKDISGKQKIEIRRKATAKDLASQIQVVDFTDNIIKRVRLSTNVNPYELNGTTSQMMYKIDNEEWQNCTPDQYGNTKLYRKDGTQLVALTGVTIQIILKGQENSIFSVPLP